VTAVSALLPWLAAALAAATALAAFLTWRAAGRGEPAGPAPAARPVADAPARVLGHAVALVGAPGAGTAALIAAARGGAGPSAPARFGAAVAVKGGAILDFGDDLLSAPDWRARWAEAVSGAADRRGDGAFDALALALRVDVLTRLHREQPAALEGLGGRLADLIEDAHRLGGWRTPLYLVLTAGETLPGFEALRAAALAEGAGGMMLGWSAAGRPDDPWEPRFATDAAETMAAALEAVALDGLSGAGGGAFAARPADALALPAAARALAAPLAALLGAALRRSAHDDPPMRRGVYLTGGGDPAGAAPAAFAAELFERKILPECGLAAPVLRAETRTARLARRLRVAAALAAVLGAGALAALFAAETEQAEASNLLTRVARFADENRRLHGDADPPLQTLSRQTALLFDDMAALTFDRVETPLAPTSYASGLDLRLRQAVAVGFDRVALRGIEIGLKARVARTGAGLAGPDGPTPEALERLASQLQALDEEARDFDALPRSTTPEALERLTEASLGVRTPPGFEDNFGVYVGGLALTRPRAFDGPGAWAALEAEAGRSASDAFAEAWRRDPASRAVTELGAQARALVGGDRNDGLAAKLGALADAVDAAETALAAPGRDWLARDGSRVEETLLGAARTIGAASFAPPGLGAALAADLPGARDAARAELFAVRGFLGRPVLTVEGGAARLDPLYPRLRDALRPLLADPVMADAARALPAPAAAPADRFGWDAPLIDQAVAATDWLQRVLVVTAADLPADLRATATAAARAAVEARVASLVESAQRPLPGLGSVAAAERAEGQAFATVAADLAALRDGAALLSLPQAQEALERSAGAQARRVLAEATRDLEEAGLYAPVWDGFSFWDGEPGGAPGMFGVTSDAALAALIREWRAYALLLAQGRAAPAIAYLDAGDGGGPGARSAAAGDWRDVLRALSDYEAGAPRNDLADLERFILIDLNEMDRATCAERLAAVRPGPSWFGARLADLRREARARCASLAATEARMARAALGEAFDAALAGRFPFAGAGAGAPLPDPGAARNPADLASIRRFFGDYGAEIARLAGAGGDGPASASTEGFAARLEAARAFLAGGAEGPPPPGIAFGVDLAFRTNPGRELGAEQILEWALAVGDQRLSSFEPPRTLIWRQGDPVTLSLRWARNAPQMPATPARPDADLGGRSVTFSYGGPWALLAMVAANAAPESDLVTLADARANVLRLTVPLIPNPDAAQGDAPRIDQAVIYLRAELRGIDPGGGQPVGPPLAMPVFPARGPGL
jgi:hypothetical protein